TNEVQAGAYAVIAGSKNKVVEMQSTDCDCSQENQQSKVPVEELGWAAAIASGVVYFLTRGRSPRPMIPAY
ncbi:VRR-NUC domain-containing protein, partial [Pseudomonas aeruginosa]